MGKQSSTQKIDRKVTPINPQPVTDMVTGFADKVQSLGQIDPQSLVPGRTDLHNQAEQTISGLGAESDAFLKSPYWHEYMNTGPALASSANADTMIQRFMDPYQQQVIDAQLAEYDQQADLDRMGETLRLNANTAFSGSGGAIAKMLGDRSRFMGRNTLSSGLRSQGFSQALGAAQQQADRDTNVSLNNAQTSNAHKQAQMQSLMQRGLALGAEDRANASLQGDFGTILRGIEQEQAMAPFTAEQLRAGIAGSVPFGLTRGEHETGTVKTTQNGGVLGGVGSALMGLGALGWDPLKGAGLPFMGKR